MDTKAEKDYLGKGFLKVNIPLQKDFDGEQHATLVFRKSDTPQSKALLYVHGFIDYFFQTEMADKFNEWGFDFYAIDLRKYGRSLEEYQHPNFIASIYDYFEEIDKSIEYIRANGVNNIILNGHSTGGLTLSLYAHHRKNVQGLILNSPFFDLNVPSTVKALAPVLAAIGKILPFAKLDSLSENYPKSLHKDYKGEWDFNENWKPITNFPAYLGWTRAIYKAQKKLQSGLKIECPTLVLYSDKSYKGKDWDEIIRISDAVLDVEHIKKYADVIGSDITKVEIKDGVHDLVLSKKEVRNKVYSEIEIWLESKHL
jgi:alpha-beta hydrolase superfamily lysophospholipase